MLISDTLGRSYLLMCLLPMAQIVAGDEIESMFGAKLGLSTLAAAGLGNLISDVIGLGMAEPVQVKEKIRCGRPIRLIMSQREVFKDSLTVCVKWNLFPVSSSGAHGKMAKGQTSDTSAGTALADARCLHILIVHSLPWNSWKD